MVCMTQFALTDATLQGTTVIEASAGTGKTWSIEQIALRRIMDGLPIDQMLLTSFTRAAAAEISQRVDAVIRKALADDESGSAPLDKPVRGRLEAASHSLDAACITTLDGFCLRMLQEHAASAGAFSLAGWQLDPDPKGSAARAVADAWSCSALLDEVWARSAGSPKAVKTALNAALTDPKKRKQMRDASYETASKAWQTWADAFVANTEARDWMKLLHPMLLKKFADPVSTLIEKWTHAAAATSAHSRAIAAVDVGRSVEKIAVWFTTPAKVLDKSASTRSRRVDATTLTAAPICLHLCAEFEKGAPLWKATADAATGVIAIDAHDRLAASRARLRLFSFQDVLERLVDALRVANPPLLTDIRERFKFAVVDECQDTNPLQAEILRRVFVESPSHDLWLVGDPKQSIYQFRGADIESYISLRDRNATDPERSHLRSLAISHRSDPALVDAVHALFDVPAPFFHAAIEPGKVTSNFAAPRTKWEDAHDGAGIVIHHGGEKETLKAAYPRIARAIQEELQAGHMVSESANGPLRPLRASDIAVLCRKNDQNRAIASELHALGIPAIVLGNVSVFQSDAAAEIAQILLALARPDRSAAALAACGGRLIGMTHAQSRDEPATWLARVRQASALLETHGVAAAIEQLVESAHTRAHGVAGLIEEEGGELLLLDYRHVLELLTAAEGDGIRGANALAYWFAEQRAGASGSDGFGGDGPDRARSIGRVDAITLQTLHSSKGLTYGITWLPTFMTPGHKSESKADADELQNNAGEPRRMLYVGLTRSRWRSHLVWLHTPKAATSPLATLVHARGIANAAEAKEKAESQLKTFAPAFADLNTLAAKSAKTIVVTPLPTATHVRSPLVTPDTLAEALALPKIERKQAQVSFTGLTSRAHQNDGSEERDIDRSAAQHTGDEPGNATAADRAIAALKIGGAPLGTALHEALADARAFAALAPGADRAPLEAALRETFAGIVVEPAAKTTLFGDLADALASAFAAPCMNSAIPSVAQIAAHPRASRREINMTTPWNGSPKDIAAAFALEPAPWSEALATKIRALGHRELKGLFVGNIDLVALHNGQWFIYDYKSNNLGAAAQNYSATRAPGKLSALDSAMVSSMYPLQAALYAVAIERWLATRETHTAKFGTSIGSIAYLFVRGMDKSIAGQGIWEWTPSPELLVALGARSRSAACAARGCA